MDVRQVGKWLGRTLLFGGAAVAAVALFAPREPAPLAPRFDAAEVPGTMQIEAWLAAREAGFADIVPGLQKRVVWAGQAGKTTPVSLVYLHGFSASSEEIRPLPDLVAEQLGANLFYTRLSGHGRGGAAMAEPAVQDWVDDLAEAVAVGGVLGERVYLIGTSTGGTLAAVAANDRKLSQRIAGVVLISPNFGLNHRFAGLLTWPLARYWLPLVLGSEGGFTPLNEAHGVFWTARYPVQAILPMAALTRAAAALDYFTVATPSLFIFSPDDAVVSVPAIRAISGQWGGPMVAVERQMGAGDDPYGHVIAGDVLSPGQTEATARIIADWIGAH
ncbi:alpha/beta fold hydrolase [Frigidibacter albus]|uniref:Alpha/beta fold hydrolase n=1 Tax=Frigidibacter albus TaxID=1465486 RepID=A0A6L8VKM7_9RHOB|nr:alpha/beta hydrolase [Frigidibacter albus]MZQ89929.1 alpha/beta fold hydrolase [Frigidibacter albus]NBE31696.1 alpha/beta fold hydrolase [Frigidibacter albus]GGH55941.1 lysophospholipase [Frigidibacter albus]